MQTINGVQIRMARAALRWSVREASSNSRVSAKTIQRVEEQDNDFVGRSVRTLTKLYDCFTQHGIVFQSDDGYGVKLTLADTNKSV